MSNVSIGERRPAEKGFVRNFMGVSMGNYGAIALSFALNVVLTWRLGAEQFGRLALLIMAVQVLASVIFNWTHTGLIRFGAQEFAKNGSVAESFWSRLLVVAPWKIRFETLIGELAASGARLIGYGAAAKANTLLNFCPRAARVPMAILDRSPLKHGRYTLGTHIPVKPADSWAEDDATHMVILAWNFQEEIIRQMGVFADRGGRFIQVIPEPGVLEPVSLRL